jgi:hypothetical protein
MRRGLVLTLSVTSMFGQAIKTGPAVGETVPDFSLQDQDGRTRSLKSTLGPKGAMLVFFRSADW